MFATDNAPIWNDKICELSSTVRAINSDAVISHHVYKRIAVLGLTILPQRDVVVLTVRERLPGGAIVVASFSLPDSHGPPPTKRITRTSVMPGSGFMVRPGKEDGCDVAYCMRPAETGSLAEKVAIAAPIAIAQAHANLWEAHVKPRAEPANSSASSTARRPSKRASIIAAK